MKMLGHPLGTLFKPLIHSGLRLGLTLVIVLMVISSPVVMLVNPASAVPSSSTDGSPSAPSTIGQDGSDFTTQAALSSLTARPTNNIVNTNSFYDVVFLTATSGAIKFIQVTFPAGTIVPTSAIFNEAEGIGPGFISQVSGQTVTYTVNNAANVPAGTKIRLEFANINNPISPSANYKVTVTTRNAANAIIDGPTQSTAYTMKQIGVNAIANNAITTPKIADDAVTGGKIAPGALSLSVREVSSDLVEIPPNSMGSVHATCNSDEVVTGGGSDVRRGGTLNEINNDVREHAFNNGWLVEVFISGPQGSAIRAFAECAKLVLSP